MASAFGPHDLPSDPNITSSTWPRLNPKAAAFMPRPAASSPPRRRSSLNAESPPFIPSSLASSSGSVAAVDGSSDPGSSSRSRASSPSSRRSDLDPESPPFVPSLLASNPPNTVESQAASCSGPAAPADGSSDTNSSSRSRSEVGSEPAASVPKPASTISRTLSPTSIASTHGGVYLDNESSDSSSQAASSSSSSSSTIVDSKPDPESPTFVPQRARLNHDEEDCETCDGYYPGTQARAPVTTSKAPGPEPPSPTPSPPPEKESPPPVNPDRFQINVLRSGGPNLPALPVSTIPMTHANVDAYTANRLEILGQRVREILTSRGLVWSNIEAVARLSLNDPYPTHQPTILILMDQMGVNTRILTIALTEVTRFAENELGFPHIHVEAKDSYLRDDYPLPDNDNIFPHDNAPPSQNDGFNQLHDSAHRNWVDDLVDEAADAQWIDNAILAEFEASGFLYPGPSPRSPTPGPSAAMIPPTPRLHPIDTITDLSDIDEDIPLLPPAVGD